MRILVLTSIYPRPAHPTWASYNRLQVEALWEAGHTVEVIAPVGWVDVIRDRLQGRPGLARYRTPQGIEIEHPIYFYPPKLSRSSYGRYYYRSVRGAFRRSVRDARPDAVFGCFAHPDGWAGGWLAREAGLPFVLKVIGSDVLVSARESSNRRDRVSEAVRGADRVVAVGRDLADRVVAPGADPARVQVVPEGLDTSVFHPGDRGEARARLALPAEGRVVLYVGNLLLSKGAGVLLEACARMAARGEPFRCYLVGRGRDEPALRAQAARLGLGDRVTLAGARPHAELADWYRAADVVTLPSFSEGIPNVLREASACGRPFVATRVGGVPEVAEPGSSLLVPPGDPAALADALADALGGGLSGGSASARRAVSWRESAGLIADAIEQAVGARRARWAAATGPSGGGPLRVLVLTTIFPRPSHETYASYNRLQFQALAEAGHAVEVIAPVGWVDAVREHFFPHRRGKVYHKPEGIRVHHPLYLYPPKVLRSLYGSFYAASSRGAFREAVREFRPDVVVGCFAYPDGWAAVRLAREAGLPVVVKAHGSSVLITAAAGGRRRDRVSEAVRGADRVVAVGRDLADRVVALGADPARVGVVYNGLDTSVFHPGDRGEARARLALPAEGRVVLYVGNLLLSKGAGVLLEACARMAARGEPFRCYLVGRGRDEPALRAQAARLGLGDRVTLAGARPHAELADWYRAADVVTLPSFSEGIPNVLREASACGRPFVATRVGGVPEVAEPGSSLLVPPGDPAALADALADALGGGLSGGSASARRAVSWRESAEDLAVHLRAAVLEHERRAGRTAGGGPPPGAGSPDPDSGRGEAPG